MNEATYIFTANISLYLKKTSATKVNKFVINELVKLTMI